MLIALTTGQKIVLAGMAAIFIAFALGAAFVLPRRNPDFPGQGGVRWFVIASAAFFAAMMLTVILVKEEETAEGHPAGGAATHEEAEQPENTEGSETGAETSDGGEAAAGDAEAGADVYASAGCGGCHTFAAAGSQGAVGPSLDQSSVDFEAARTQIANGGGGMPAFRDQLTEQQIDDVTAFVVERRGG